MTTPERATLDDIISDAGNWTKTWTTTRHCPACGSTSLRISSDDPLSGGWCSTSCAACGHELRIDYLDQPPWEDPAWTAAGEQ
jgi:hypothetical protein